MKHYRPAASGIRVPPAALALWQPLSALGWVNAIILPSPLQVLAKWWAYLRPLEVFDPAQGSYLKWCFSGELIQDALGSLYRVLLGFFIGGGLALPLGLAMGHSKVAYGLFNPLVQVLRPIPPIAYIPLSILWFGLGNPPAVFLISIGAFIVVIVSEMIAVNNGLGYRILEAREYLWSDKIIAGMFTIGLLGLGIDTLMSRLGSYLLKWHRGLEQG